MKLKLLGLACLSLLCLASCGAEGGKEPGNISTTVQSTSQQEQYNGKLKFLEKGKARIEVHDLDIQISYGNEAIAAPYKIVTLSNSSQITINKNMQNSDLYTFVIYADYDNNSSSHLIKVSRAIEGDSLLEYQSLILNNILNGYDRAYISISKSSEAVWTKGLNADLDAEITVMGTDAK